MRTRIRNLLLSTVVGGLALAAPAAPARAALPALDAKHAFELAAANTVGTPGQAVSVAVYPHGSAKHVVITIDTAASGGRVVAGATGGNCTTSGTTATCTADAVYAPGPGMPPAKVPGFVLWVGPGARLGDVIPVDVTSSADGYATTTKRGYAHVAEEAYPWPGPGIVSTGLTARDVVPGATVPVPFRFQQYGEDSRPWDGVLVELAVDADTTAVDEYRNCATRQYPAREDDPAYTTLMCAVPGLTTVPGTIYRTGPDTPIRVRTSRSAPADRPLCGCSIRFSPAYISDLAVLLDEWARTSPGRRTFTLEADPDQTPWAKPWVDRVEILPGGIAAWDLDIADATATGRQGDVVPMTITVTNRGPAALPVPGFTYELDAALPTGLEYVPGDDTGGAPMFCYDGGRNPWWYGLPKVDVTCAWNVGLAPGESVSVTIDVRVTGDRSAADGKAVLDLDTIVPYLDGVPDDDPGAIGLVIA